jgi:hypothetical protein
MTRKTDIVVTTIWEPAWLSGYLESIRAAGRASETTLRIICDRKTPSSVYAAADAARREGFRVDCPTLDEQAAYLRKIGAPDDLIPWDTDNRRNIGFLRAWESGADILVSIDDDNLCPPGLDLVGAHHCVGAPAGRHAAHAAWGPWFNICALLQCNPPVRIFPRGFPYAARGSGDAADREPLAAPLRDAIVAVNAGLWTDEPDVDAITRLALRPRVASASADAVILGSDTGTPINTQNTALLREALPAYYYVRMGFPLQGMKIDRFGDILSGYFVQKCAKHAGHAVRLGSPVAVHKRTAHNLFTDLYHELAGIVLVEDLLPWLRELRLEGTGYAESYAALAGALRQAASRFKGFVWDQGGRDFLGQTAQCMETWLGLLRRLG